MNNNGFDTIYPLLGPTISSDTYVDIDCSVERLGGRSAVDYDTLDSYVNKVKAKAKAKAAIGGYLEKRNLYRGSNHFETGPVRNIHLGIDLWIEGGTPIYAPIGGVIHSYAFNPAYLDYGYALIMEHQHNNRHFYTLYGHLSSEFFSIWRVGNSVEAGSQIATLGMRHENGDWPAHLHFQMIMQIGDYKGDYPGVCATEDLSYYRQNCPDPSVLIKKGP